MKVDDQESHSASKKFLRPDLGDIFTLGSPFSPLRSTVLPMGSQLEAIKSFRGKNPNFYEKDAQKLSKVSIGLDKPMVNSTQALAPLVDEDLQKQRLASNSPSVRHLNATQSISPTLKYKQVASKKELDIERPQFMDRKRGSLQAVSMRFGYRKPVQSIGNVKVKDP